MMKGFSHVQGRICAKPEQEGTNTNNSFDSQQSRRSHCASCSDNSVVLSRQKSRGDSRNVEYNRSDRLTHNSEFQRQRPYLFGGQASRWPSSKDYGALHLSTERSGAKIPPRFWISIQFVDIGQVTGISGTTDRYAAESPVFIATDGEAGNSISASEACDGTSAECQRLQREKGFSGVFKKSATERQARFDLLYLDECEVHLHPTLTKVWTLKGTRPVVPAAGNNQRLCLYGAFDYKSGRVHYMSHPKKDSKRFSQFLSQLLSSNSERFLILVLDNASYHRTSAILDILAEHEHHVFVVWLPKYSPELNLIEGLWGYLKRSALNNYFYGDVASLEAAVDDSFTELQQHPETALSLTYRTSKNLRKIA